MRNASASPAAPPDNVFWHVMAGAQARFAVGHGGARRYAPAFSPIVAFEDPAAPDFASLAPYCGPGELVYIEGVAVPFPADWRVEVETSMYRMVWRGGTIAGDAAFSPIPLEHAHVAQAVALASLTRPGPFGPRTIELGDYFGVFDGERLVAMAGERAEVGCFREISGVCTHPDARGRGLARSLMLHLMARETARGQIPFLHVIATNAAACALYEALGFAVCAHTPVRVAARAADETGGG